MSFILSIFMIQGRPLKEWDSYYIKTHAHTHTENDRTGLKLSTISKMSNQRKQEQMLAKTVFDDTNAV